MVVCSVLDSGAIGPTARHITPASVGGCDDAARGDFIDRDADSRLGEIDNVGCARVYWEAVRETDDMDMSSQVDGSLFRTPGIVVNQHNLIDHSLSAERNRGSRRKTFDISASSGTRLNYTCGAPAAEPVLDQISGSAMPSSTGALPFFIACLTAFDALLHRRQQVSELLHSPLKQGRY